VTMFLARPNSAVPAAPGTPTLTATALGSASIRLQASGTAAAGFKTWEFTASATLGGVYVPLATQGSPIFDWTGLSPSTTYYFKVRGTTNADQVTAFSAAVSATTDPATAPPPPVFSPNYPRLGYYYVNTTQWGNSANFAKLANASVLIFTHYNGAEAAAGRTLRSAIDGIKAVVPVGMGAEPVHTAYIVHDECFDSGSGDSATARLRTKLSAENWYLRATFPGGAIVESSFAANLDLINRTSVGQSVDGGGKNWIEWYADLMYVQNVTGEAGNTANPSLDGMFLDNCYWKPRVAGDYNRDGSSDSASDSGFASAERTGIASHFDYMRTIWPGSHQIGNISDWPLSDPSNIYNDGYTPNVSLLSPLAAKIDGGIGGEYLIDNATINSEPGVSFEYQERTNGLSGFRAGRNSMRLTSEMVTNPALLIFSVRDITGDNSTADNQRLRFGAAWVTVCSDGAIDDRRMTLWSSLPTIYTGGTAIGWLGQASETPRYSAYQNGVYVRRFASGYVAVNPRNNGSQTFTLPVAVRNVVTSVDYASGAAIPILDRDGVFLRII
jgi:hypothetical protein